MGLPQVVRATFTPNCRQRPLPGKVSITFPNPTARQRLYGEQSRRRPLTVVFLLVCRQSVMLCLRLPLRLLRQNQ